MVILYGTQKCKQANLNMTCPDLLASWNCHHLENQVIAQRPIRGVAQGQAEIVLWFSAPSQFDGT